MVKIDMDLSQAESFLNSQVKKQENGISESQAKAFQKIWKNHRQKIHDCLVNRCMWNDTLKDMAWRVDVKSRSMHTEQINIPVVNLVMDIGSNDDEVHAIRSSCNSWLCI